MTIRLPQDLEAYVKNQVTSGLFASPDDAIAEAIRLLRRQQPAPAASEILTTEDVDRQLLARGLLSRLPDPSEDLDDDGEDDLPVPVEGEPVSETIIRERR
jgi:Arc/MetJ-type ribon-helix-helix transcriptional regulator